MPSNKRSVPTGDDDYNVTYYEDRQGGRGCKQKGQWESYSFDSCLSLPDFCRPG